MPYVRISPTEIIKMTPEQARQLMNANPLPTPPRTASDVDAIAALALKGQFPAARIEELGLPVLCWPDKSMTSLEHLHPRPAAKRGVAALVDAPSFIAYVKRHETPGTIIVGDYSETGGRFAATLDHHVPNAQNAEAKVYCDIPGWSEHTATLHLAPTPEWERWLKAAKEPMGQIEFAQFLEENAEDVCVPDEPALHGVRPGTPLPSAAELSAVALTLQVNSEVRFNSAVKLSNGSTELRFSEAVAGTYGGAEQKLAVPELFTLALAPFQGAPKYVVQVRLRYRASGGKATFGLQLVRPHKVVETAWQMERARIEEQTGHQVLRGSLNAQTRKI